MKGRLIDLSLGLNRKQRITVEVEGDFRGKFDSLKECDVSVEINKYRELRSKTANAYFHLLRSKIAEVQCLGEDEVKIRLVCEYGALAKGADGATVGLMLPDTVDVSTVYPYTKCFDTRVEGGVTFNCYLAYKRTRLMNTKEMYRLIDGTRFEAQGLGIEVETPEELAKLKSLWEKNDKKTMKREES